MKPKIVDARGQICPIPLVMTKKAIEETKKDVDTLVVLIDNETSKENVERFLEDNGFTFKTETGKDGSFQIQVSRSGKSGLKQIDVEEYCSVQRKPNAGASHVVCIKSDKMGIGPDDLGGILLQAFINTLKEVKPLPEAVVFYNTGIKMAVEGSPVLESLKILEERGVKIMVCGTCVNYFNVKDKIRAGIVSNMLDIIQTLTNAGHVVEP